MHDACAMHPAFGFWQGGDIEKPCLYGPLVRLAEARRLARVL
jgi:hypothetical protein